MVEHLLNENFDIENSFLIGDRETDELVLLDISATLEGRETFTQVVSDVAKAIAIPFTVGGGISSIEHAEKLLKAGADKISVNTAAIKNPRFIGQLAEEFGSQCVVVAIDAILTVKGWEVVSHAGTVETGITASKWAKTCEILGAGEILLTSHTSDGTRAGFAIDLTREIAQMVAIPVIASGGAGKPEHFVDVFTKGKANAALAAGIFHYHQFSISEVKDYLLSKGILIRY